MWTLAIKKTKSTRCLDINYFGSGILVSGKSHWTLTNSNRDKWTQSGTKLFIYKTWTQDIDKKN